MNNTHINHKYYLVLYTECSMMSHLKKWREFCLVLEDMYVICTRRIKLLFRWRGWMESVGEEASRILYLSTQLDVMREIWTSSQLQPGGWIQAEQNLAHCFPPLTTFTEQQLYSSTLQATRRTAVSERNFPNFFLWSLRSVKSFSCPAPLLFYNLTLRHIFFWLLIMTFTP